MFMKSHKNLYNEVISLGNLTLAWRKARKGKTKKDYVKTFEEDLIENLLKLHSELKNQTYSPEPLKTFILRDPKTRKISKSAFRDRIVHHALCNIIEPIFDKSFIYDNSANRKGKGTLFALKRLDYFIGKVTNNRASKAFCLKADIKHYFQEINHSALLEIIKRKIKDKQVLQLIRCILREREREREAHFLINRKGMPLGNLTSQFFANVYLNELDRFVKHKLRVKYYIRYVDDFVILHKSKKQLDIWKREINRFLLDKLRIELHPDKSRIINLSRGVDFVGFRNFYFHKLLRKRNIKNMRRKIHLFNQEEISYNKFIEIFQGWKAYSDWSNNYKLIFNLIREIKSFHSFSKASKTLESGDKTNT